MQSDEDFALLRCTPREWIDAGSFASVVEVVATDSQGGEVVFLDKVPVFAWRTEPVALGAVAARGLDSREGGRARCRCARVDRAGRR